MGPNDKRNSPSVSERGFEILKAHMAHLVEPLDDRQLLALADALHDTIRDRRRGRGVGGPQRRSARVIPLDARHA